MSTTVSLHEVLGLEFSKISKLNSGTWYRTLTIKSKNLITDMEIVLFSNHENSLFLPHEVEVKESEAA